VAKQKYIAAMDVLHKACVFISASCLVIMTVIIPWGVFTRYVLGFGSSWPEPMAILLMIVFTFFSASACYRDGLHIAVMAVADMVSPGARRLLGLLAEVSMVSINLFMLIWGYELVLTTWHQVIGEFPLVTAGVTYLPIPVGGTITLLFVIERLWKGEVFPTPAGATLGSSVMD
jgi:TRAP-type C4-dicarboxylate transport system permease small subunit